MRAGDSEGNKISTSSIFKGVFQMARNTKNHQSIRIKLEGVLSSEDLRKQLNEAVDDLEGQGVQTVKNCNLYVTPAYGEAEKKQTTTIGLSTYKSAADIYGV